MIIDHQLPSLTSSFTAACMSGPAQVIDTAMTQPPTRLVVSAVTNDDLQVANQRSVSPGVAAQQFQQKFR